MPRISVIIPNYNGAQHLPECLSTLQAQDIQEPFDTIVVDNGSTDDSLALMTRDYPNVTVVPLRENKGFATACNAGVDQSKADYFVLLNNDTRLPPEWLRELVKALDEADADVFAIGSLLILYNHPDRVNSMGGHFSPMGGGFDQMLGEKIEDANIPTTPYVTAIAPGAAAIYRRELYEKIGRLDDRYFMYFEDVELCYRAWKQGYKSLMAPRAIVYHKYGATAGPRDSPVKIYWGQRNRLRMIARNYGSEWFLKSMLILIAYTGFRIVALAAYRRFETIQHLVRGSLDGLRDLPELRSAYRPERHAAMQSDHDMAGASFFASVEQVVKEGKRIRSLREAGIEV